MFIKKKYHKALEGFNAGHGTGKRLGQNFQKSPNYGVNDPRNIRFELETMNKGRGSREGRLANAYDKLRNKGLSHEEAKSKIIQQEVERVFKKLQKD